MTKAPAQERSIFLLEVKGAIGPATSDYIHRGLEQARKEGAPFVILRIDTPGGLASSMRDINKDILASNIPVIGFVAPSGARAASAGTYMLYACHVAAMAPGTNLGAATPVQIGGGGGSPFPTPKSPSPVGKGSKTSKSDKASDSSEKPKATMSDKILNDSVAYIKSLAQLRKRNVDWAEKAVREAASLPAEEAVKLKVIDLMADDLPALLEKLNGRKLTINNREVVLDTLGASVKTIEPDWRVRLLGVITNPNVAYILMLIGIYGLILEFYNPGGLVPGVLGAISLLLALYALNVLPVNYAGMALMLLGIALMVAEVFAPSFGIMGIGGGAAFVLGSLMLIDTDIPEFRITWLLIGPIAVALSGAMLLIFTMLARSRTRPVVTGREQMLGDTGRVIDWSGPNGRVRIHGEVWKAQSGNALSSGQQVKVDDIEGLTLIVSADHKRR